MDSNRKKNHRFNRSQTFFSLSMIDIDYYRLISIISYRLATSGEQKLREYDQLQILGLKTANWTKVMFIF